MVDETGRVFRGSYRIGQSIVASVSPQPTAASSGFSPRAFVRSFFFRPTLEHRFENPPTGSSGDTVPASESILPCKRSFVRSFVREPDVRGGVHREDERTDGRTDGPRGDDAIRYDRIRRSIVPDPDPDRSITPCVVGFSWICSKSWSQKKPDVRGNLATIWGLDWI